MKASDVAAKWRKTARHSVTYYATPAPSGPGPGILLLGQAPRFIPPTRRGSGRRRSSEEEALLSPPPLRSLKDL